MLLTLSMGKIKEVTMKIVLNFKYWDESQLEVYRDIINEFHKYIKEIKPTRQEWKFRT